MAEKIEVGRDAKIALVEIDKNRNVEDGIGVEIAKANPVVPEEVAEEGMYWDAKSTPKKILKNHQLVGVRHGKGLTGGRAPSGGLAVRENPRLHLAVKLELAHGRGNPRLIMAGLL